MKLNVLFLSSWFPSRVHPTLGNFVIAHAQAVARFHEVTVLYVKGDDIASVEIAEEKLDNIRIVRVYYPSKSKFTGRFSAFLAGLKHLDMKTGQFHLAQLNMVWKEGWQAVYLKRKFNLPFVISDNWTGYHPDQRGPLPWYIKKYMRWVANQAALLLPVTQHLEKAMRNLQFSPPSIVIPNAVDLSTFRPITIDSSETRFLHISHLDQAHKNIRGILHVWKKFSDQHSDVLLSIGGDGDVELWQKEAADLHIRSTSISFFGTLTREQVAKKMQTHHCHVLFSNYENLPLVIVEAMACGLSIIATDAGGTAEHICHDPAHKLIDRGDEPGLLRAFEATRVEKDSIDREQIHTYAVEHFGLEAVGKAFTEAYRTIVP